MKPKNVNFLDLYIEKIILAGAVVFALAVCWFFVLGRPYSVQIDGQTVGPDAVAPLVNHKAEALDKRISNDQSPLPSMTVPRYTDSFKRRYFTPVLKDVSDYPVAFGPPGLDPKQTGPTGTEFTPRHFALPSPPAPTDVLVQSDLGVLLDEQQIMTRVTDRVTEALTQAAKDAGEQPDAKDIAAQAQARADQIAQGYRQLVSAQAPRDFQYVSVQAQYDLDDWKKLLQETPEEERVPEDWWRTMMFLVEVEIHRQVQDPASGQWGAVVSGQFTTDESIVIPSLPGSISFRDLPTTYTPDEATHYITEFRVNQDRIARTEFAPLAKGVWLPPDVPRKRLDEKDARRLQELDEEMQKLETRIRAIQRQISRQAPGEHREPPPPRTGTRPRPTPPRPAPPRSTGPANTQRTQAAQDAEKKRAEQRNELLNSLLDDLEKKRAEKSAILNPLAPDAAPGPDGAKPGPTGTPPPSAPRTDPTRSTTQAEADYIRQRKAAAAGRTVARPSTGAASPGATTSLGADVDATPSQIKIWAHDLTVQPGKTYRYRVTVKVGNPLFGQKQVAKEQRDENLHKLTLTSQPSEWSGPVTIDPAMYWFVIDAAGQKNQATFEVWRVFDGVWQSHEFVVRPGDMIGGIVDLTAGQEQAAVDMRINGIMVDLMEKTSGSGGPVLGNRRYAVLYLDADQGRLDERNPDEDRDSPTRVRLQADATLRGRVAEAPPAGKR